VREHDYGFVGGLPPVFVRAQEIEVLRRRMRAERCATPVRCDGVAGFAGGLGLDRLALLRSVSGTCANSGSLRSC